MSADLTKQLWILCRAAFNINCKVPDWSGRLSQTCEQTDAVIPSRICYMKPILHPITDFATVKKCLNSFNVSDTEAESGIHTGE